MTDDLNLDGPDDLDLAVAELGEDGGALVVLADRFTFTSAADGAPLRVEGPPWADLTDAEIAAYRTLERLGWHAVCPELPWYGPVEIVEPGGWTVTEPGVVDGMPEDVYHGDPVPGWSLSASGTKLLLPPSVPAKWLHHRRHAGGRTSRALDVGRAAHAKVLGVGGAVFVPTDPVTGEPYARWDTNASKAQIAQARARGDVVLKPDDAAVVDAMAEALLDNPRARDLLESSAGRTEQSAFVPDPVTGVWMRARFDWLPEPVDDVLLLADYKTAADASPEAAARAMGDHGYHRSAAWYRRIARLLGLASRVGFLLVVQEKSAPYLVNVVTPDADAMAVAEGLNARALVEFARCRESGEWPGYGDDVTPLALPAYQLNRELEYVRDIVWQ